MLGPWLGLPINVFVNERIEIGLSRFGLLNHPEKRQDERIAGTAGCSLGALLVGRNSRQPLRLRDGCRRDECIDVNYRASASTHLPMFRSGQVLNPNTE